MFQQTALYRILGLQTKKKKKVFPVDDCEFLPIASLVWVSGARLLQVSRRLHPGCLLVMATDTVKIDDLQRLRRFFYLGNDHGLYRVRVGPERCLSAESAPIVSDLLAKGRGEEVVEEVVKFLSGDRTCCTNHAPALFTLAMCARFEDQSQTTKQAAVKAMGKACSSTADLFQFISFAQCLRESRRGWGRSLKNGVQRWFDSKTSMELAEIVTRQKTGSKWSYIDLLRVTHVVPKTEGKCNVHLCYHCRLQQISFPHFFKVCATYSSV